MHITRSFLQLWVPVCLCMFCIVTKRSPSLPAGALRTQVSTGVPPIVLTHVEGPAPHFCGQLALWSRSFNHHPLAQFLDRPCAIHTGYLAGLWDPPGPSTLYLEPPLWYFLGR